MRQLVLARPGAVVLREAPDPRPAPGEAVVRIIACGVCGSDLRQLRESRAEVVHWGHEIVGEVTEVGRAADEALLGHAVLAHTSRPCERCRACAAGRPAGCSDWTYHPYNGFADVVCLPVPLLSPVPGPVDALDALTEPLYVALDVAARTGLGPGDSAVLLGVGPIGLLALHCLASAGVSPIHAVYRGDPGPRVELAARWGAIPLSTAEFAERGEDLRCSAAVVTAPYPTVPSVVPAVARGGRIVYNGITAAATVPIDLHRLHTHRIELVPSFPHPQTGFAAARAMLGRDRAVLADLVTHRIPLATAPAVFAGLGSAGMVKALITAG
jgi:threonine dehydrogenase-like Zn-dependent dehydrogenase